MQVQKYHDASRKTLPVIAALPYRIEVGDQEFPEDVPTYDPSQQRTIYAGRDYSTSREHDSAGGLFSTKSDTKKDD